MEECADFLQVDTQRLHNHCDVLEDFSGCEKVQVGVTNTCHIKTMVRIPKLSSASSYTCWNKQQHLQGWIRYIYTYITVSVSTWLYMTMLSHRKKTEQENLKLKFCEREEFLCYNQEDLIKEWLTFLLWISQGWGSLAACAEHMLQLAVQVSQQKLSRRKTYMTLSLLGNTHTHRWKQ